MPIFDYKCTKCEFVKERIVSFDFAESDYPMACPHNGCGHDAYQIKKIYKTSWHPGKTFYTKGFKPQ